MAWFPDLAPFTGLPGRDLVAVGWLQKGKPFAKAKRADEALANRLTRSEYREGQFRTRRREHRCDLCRKKSIARFGRGEILVIADDRIFVAPELIAHYVRAHGYQPPKEFVAALQDAPHQGAPAFREALLRHGVIETLERTYTAQDIEVLEGLEPVRRRPGMYVGGTGPQGALHVVYEVLANALDQTLLGHGTTVSVDVKRSGWIEIEDDGAGIPTTTSVNGLSYLEVAFTSLHSGPTLDGHTPHVHVAPGLFGVGIGVANALCSRMEVETRFNGERWQIGFSSGRTISPLRCCGRSERRGTRIRFRLDEEIFGTHAVDAKALKARMIELAYFMPKVRLFCQGHSVSRPQGFAGLLADRVPSIVAETVLSGRAELERIGVEYAFGWSAALHEPLRVSYVNMGQTPEGGTHARAAVNAVRSSTKDADLRSASERGLCMLIHVSMLDPEFGGPTKSHLSSRKAGPIVTEIVREAIAKAPWFWDAIHSAVR